MDVHTTSQRLEANNVVDNVYTTSVFLEGEFSLAKMQAAVGNNYVKLHSAFNNFQNQKCLLDQKTKYSTCFQEHLILSKSQLNCSLFSLTKFKYGFLYTFYIYVLIMDM